METEQINKFKRDFKSLVYQKGLLTESNNRIKQLSRFDKNGSHQRAIMKELQTKDNINAKIKEIQKSVDYEEWRKTSKRLTLLLSKLKLVASRKRIIENELFEFKSF